MRQFTLDVSKNEFCPPRTETAGSRAVYVHVRHEATDRSPELVLRTGRQSRVRHLCKPRFTRNLVTTPATVRRRAKPPRLASIASDPRPATIQTKPLLSKPTDRKLPGIPFRPWRHFCRMKLCWSIMRHSVLVAAFVSCLGCGSSAQQDAAFPAAKVPDDRAVPLGTPSSIKTNSRNRERALGDLKEAGVVRCSLDSSMIGLKSGLILSFDGANPSDDSLAALEHLHDLYELDFGRMAKRVGPTDAQLRHLKPLIQLRSLCLNKTFVTDKGLAHIMPLRNLEFLDLSFTTVTYTALEPLVRGLPKLRWLYIEENWQITLDQVQKLETLRPGCEVIR